jgi:hypothetical protein
MSRGKLAVVCLTSRIGSDDYPPDTEPAFRDNPLVEPVLAILIVTVAIFVFWLYVRDKP